LAIQLALKACRNLRGKFRAQTSPGEQGRDQIEELENKLGNINQIPKPKCREFESPQPHHSLTELIVQNAPLNRELV